MLHILLNSPYNISVSSLLSFSSIFDDLICIQDGVLLSVINNFYYKKIYNNFNLVYFLKDDLSARGLLEIAKKNHLIMSNYQNFVYLTAGHNTNMTW
ncbi:Protein TusB [Buchnera aphidicola (Cinara kochiana kochiana)]|uniref:Protein TusB n=1 Tax=Buchnera aphidicola (Cinara kochiana kochiana) TaxID=2518976 RepID=A0A451D6B5_9GAMM|nr:sulfurtransferase complex subunit TusB [Buchnera aphidicola]VFP81254.1 Protein TusB [Buchnera aphidicola (Cinara kochiana kochiana)]